MTFGSPRLIWLLLLLLPITALLWWSWRAKQRMMSQFIGTRLLDALTVGVSKTRQKIRLALLASAIALSLFSLARPQWGFELEEAKQRGLDLVIAIDTSKSMLADDIQPNRLQRAKLSALDLMRLAKSDRLGLVAFAGSAFLQCPLSLDDEAFRQSVEALDVNIIPQGGSAIAEAIQTALSAFKEKTENHKILILFTDGEDNDEEGSALEAARSAAKDGLRIFTIGVGTPNGELLSTTDPYGNRVFIKDTAGNVVKSRLNESLLQQIAKATEGFYLPLSGATTMDALYERGLAPLPKAEFAAKTVRQYHERYQWFLGAAILLLLTEMLFPERKMSSKSKVQVPIKAGVVAIISFFALANGAFGSANDALKNFERGKYEKARDEFERLARKKPDDPRLRYNAGTAAFNAEDFGGALKHFSASLSSPDLKLQERSYYNLGNTQFRAGERAKDPKATMEQWDQAVHNYESALKLDPNDADATFNLELVKKKLEELKQQQQQQKQQNKDDKNQDDKKDEQQKQNEQNKQDQKKDQQDQQEKSEQEKKEEQQKQEQQKKDEAEQKKQEQSEQEQQQTAQDQRGKEPDQQPKEAQNYARVMQMTPQQATQLLEAQKAEEKAMIFIPQNLKTNRNPNRVFKDW